MGFFTFILIITFSLVLLSSYLLIALNENVISLDLLFIEVQLSTGLALLSFFLAGAILTIFLEILVKLAKKNRDSQ